MGSVATDNLLITAEASPASHNADAAIPGSSDVSVIAGNIAIQGGLNTGTGTATAGITTTTGAIDLLSFGDLTIIGSTVSARSNEAQIAATTSGSVVVVVLGDATLSGELGEARMYTASGSIDLATRMLALQNGTAYIQSVEGGAVNLFSQGAIDLEGGAVLSRGEAATAIAGTDFNLTGMSSVTNGGSSILVCDNSFPTPPLVGPWRV